MKLHNKIQLLQFCSSLLYFIFVALGLSVAGCGLWILFDSSSFIHVVSSGDMQFVAVVLLAVGVVVLVVSGLGIVGAQRESRLLLLLVACFLVILVLAQIFVTFLLLINKDKISKTLTENVDSLIQKYPENEHRLLDNMQHYAKCCGRMGPSDWQSNQFVVCLNQSEAAVLPCSCFSSNRQSPSSFCTWNQTLTSNIILYQPANSTYNQGCEVALRVWLKENVLTIVGMDLCLIFLQVLLLAMVVALWRSFGAKASVKSSNPDQTESDLYQNQVYSDQDLLYQELDQGLVQEVDHRVYQKPYEGPYDGPHGGPYDGPYNGPYD
ncbi:CD82 antigen isoform X1 [Periophthalmus magnuspinnatus]|uniref:CD82 antigen isoform X1 n=1 Tax=Periophthalmus magnuspinnatus TaxID=409849 RepID=UPI00243633EF|nr:CD82 antigen isoform X1 [Periophthalmus magnuspinnatus]